MDQSLSGGAKFGYFILGFFLGLIGVLIAWLVNKNGYQEIKSGAIKFSLIGFAVTFVLNLIAAFTIWPVMFATLTAY